MKVIEFFNKSKRGPQYRYEIWVAEIDGIVIQWSEQREGLHKVAEYYPVWVSHQQLEKLLNRDGSNQQYEIKRNGNKIRLFKI